MAATTNSNHARAATAQPARRPHKDRHAATEAIAANQTHLRFAVGDTRVDVTLPPLDMLAYYAGLGGAAAFGLISWPIAVFTGAGHLLAADRHNRTLHALGTAIDAAS